MNQTTKALAKRAVAAKGWRWMDGMAGEEHYGRRQDEFRTFRVFQAPHEHETAAIVFTEWSREGMMADTIATCIPDLDDPATKGCVLHLVREKHGDTNLSVTFHEVPVTGPIDPSLDPDIETTFRTDWIAILPGRRPLGFAAASETEALVLALEQECEDGR